MRFGNILSLDLEITKDGKHLKHMGAVLVNVDGSQIEIESKAGVNDSVSKLNALASNAQFLLGHNILEHDIPWLKLHSQTTDGALFQLPIIDTLFLSPLAFPKNPYHRLVKDYKIVKDSLNNPIADAQLALSIFEDQLDSFKEQYTNTPNLIELYAYLFKRHADTKKLANVFDTFIVGASELSPAQLMEEVTNGKACNNQLESLIAEFNREHLSGLSLAYALAWLQVSGGNSVLPPWVWRKHPNVKNIIKRLRDKHCGDESCLYCHSNFDSVAYLNRFFELPDFRPLPDGTPLQKNIIDASIQNEPHLGILPTGGGKSLCFQLPALVRNIRTGSITIVISPLQALMKDQVDNLKNKVGLENVAAIYGMLTMPERMMIIDQVRMGDIAILYLSPEQLRNKNVKQAIQSRQVGAWVFDEAHCLSKWGHDFRPDYLYCAKVIAQMASDQEEAPPPVFCYTATAKLDVIEDIVNHFKQKLNMLLNKFEGGVKRENLAYDVVETKAHHKESLIFQLLDDYFGNDKPGSCVIYCASRRQVEELAETIQQGQSLSVAHFHAGLDASEKREILESFISGVYRIIVATNAFGMGIDKEDVRLVIHYDIPGSLENYLQEAGRAGRDLQSANCILLFDQKDIETQFKLTKQSEIRFKDINEILKEVRYRAKYTDGKVVATSKELLRSEYVDTSIGVDDHMADTKVKTAISWLEREGFLSREENVNSVFQGKPLFANLNEAKEKLASLQLSSSALRRWELILEALLNADPDEGINADDILDQIIPKTKQEQEKKQLTPENIMQTLAQMADCGLVSKGFSMTTYLRPKGKDNCRLLYEKLCEIELFLIDYLPEIAPDIDAEASQFVDLRELNSFTQKEKSAACSTRLLRQLFKTWSEDGKTSDQEGSISFKTSAKDVFTITINRPWSMIKKIAIQRHVFTQKIVNCLYLGLNTEQANSHKKIMVEFSLEEMMAKLKTDIGLTSLLAGKHLNDQQEFLLKGIRRALLFLDTHKVIELHNGMAVFKQAMEIKVPLDKKDRYQKANYRQLEDHYHQKVVQVHVMYEYARLALKGIKAALNLVQDYFENSNEAFLSKYFAKRKAFLERATSQESWNEIVTQLNNHEQQEIVHAKLEENQLVLAGPGAGKTKVIIHRIAYLLRVEQVPSSKILVLTYNHNAAISLHKRLVTLIGKEAAFIRVNTFHGLALRLLGQSFDAQMLEQKGFDSLIEDATKLLKGEVVELGLDEHHQRSSMLEGIEHILVDEYQDIDQTQYDFIAALSGKNLEADEKLSLMAVGDDDQSIYSFRDANVRFIQQFKDDYQATVRYLVQNYRSTQYIIAAANSLIDHNKDRMKSEHSIEINNARKIENHGGRMADIDPVHLGKVKVITCQNVYQQANEVLSQIQQIRKTEPDFKFEDIAILSRHGIEKPELALIRSLLHENKLPYQYSRATEDSFSLYSVREFIHFKKYLQDNNSKLIGLKELFNYLPPEKNHWHLTLETLFNEWLNQFGEEPIVAHKIETLFDEYLFEQKRQTLFGNGILLSTVHGAKGEEYKYVFVLDGNWQLNDQSTSKQEDERRLYYVAMTRAIDQLILFYRQDQRNPHIPLIDQNQTATLFSDSSSTQSSSIKFNTTGLKKLYISYASKYPELHKIHKVLQNLNANDEIHLRDINNFIYLNYQGEDIARISKLYTEEFRKILNQPYQAKVIAMVGRQHDPENEYEKNAKVKNWWLPVIEVIY